MICRKCQREYDDTMNFCPDCGEPRAKVSDYTQERPTYTPARELLTDEQKKEKEKSLILWGALSFIVALCGPLVADLVIAIIARKRVNEYLLFVNDSPEGLAKDSKNLALAALIISIIKVGFYVMFIGLYVALIFMAAFGEMAFMFDTLY